MYSTTLKSVFYATSHFKTSTCKLVLFTVFKHTKSSLHHYKFYNVMQVFDGDKRSLKLF